MANTWSRIPQGTIIKASDKSKAFIMDAKGFILETFEQSRNLSEIKNYKSALEANHLMHV